MVVLNRRRLWLLLVPAAAVAIASAVLPVMQPWEEEPAYTGAIYQLCDLTIPMPPADFDIFPLENGGVMALIIRSPARPDAQYKRSQISIDVRTGEVISKTYVTPSDESVLELLSQRRMAPLDPSSAPWPYTDATQVPAERGKGQAMSWRRPDPGAGLLLSYIISDGEDFYVNSLVVKNCRSEMRIDATVRAEAPVELTVPMRNVHPDDETAFQNFESEVRVENPRY